jgi:uncharacterized membrane protein YhdT
VILTKKDKTVAFIIVFLFFAAWIVLAYLTKTGAFNIFADVIKDPGIITK